MQQHCEPRVETAHIASSETADILQQLGSDEQSICAGMLHCYSPFSEAELNSAQQVFGKATIDLLLRVNRIDELSNLLTNQHGAAHSDNNEENLRRMLLTMIDDVRVVLIKLSCQLQILRCAKSSSKEYQHHISRLTLDVYAPLANRLGIWQLKWEMEDYSLRYLEPESYKALAKNLDENDSTESSISKTVLQPWSRRWISLGSKPTCTVDRNISTAYGRR